MRNATCLFVMRACAAGGALACLLLSACPAAAEDALAASAPQATAQPSLALRNGLVIAGETTLVAAYGMHQWWHNDFAGGFGTTNEGWFGANTQFGGTDKLGHMYVNYANTRLLVPLFESLGNGHDHAVSLAGWATLGIFTGIEIADGYSRTWQFSPHDELANLAGVALGVLNEKYPALDRALDFRVDYRRSPRSPRFDPFSDYSELKFLFVLKADGFAALRGSRLTRYLEVSLGYGTQGYDTGGPRSRTLYFGLSLNLARLLADVAYDGEMHTTTFQRGADRLFDLVQFPAVVYHRREVH